MTEPVPDTAAAPRTASGTAPEDGALDLADFPGCKAIHIPRDEIEDYEGRLEYWEARSETAIVVCEPTTIYHERPSQRLARLTALIAASRGSATETLGTSDLVRFYPDGRREKLMQADQVVYLNPRQAALAGPAVDVDADVLPDVVLEVDYSTDARLRKRSLYEDWGFPELWIDVPEEREHPRSRVPALTIHVLQAGRFVEAPSSRAFPGWTAREIHRAMHEPLMSHETVEALHRVGRGLGAAEGTGPDDDPWLRRERAQGRAEGHAAGQAEGHAAGRAEAIVAILEARRIAAGTGLADRLAEFTDRSTEEMIRAAQTCASEDDLLRLLRR